MHRRFHHCVGATHKGVRDFLLTAAAVSGIIKSNASISGAEVGCQGEVGSAAAMAAAGRCAALGGSNAQVENAAEIALEHHLGMTCDPIRGLARLALLRTLRGQLSVDQVTFKEPINVGELVTFRASVILAAMAVVKAGARIPPRSLAMDSPARVTRELTDQEIDWKTRGTGIYQRLALEAREKPAPAEPLSAPEPGRRRVRPRLRPARRRAPEA